MALGKMWHQGVQVSGRKIRGRPKGRRNIIKKNVIKKALENMAEHKYLDTSFTGSYSSTGTMAVINTPTIGGNPTDRIGRRCKWTSIEMKALCANQDASSQTIRIMVILDKQPNGVQPATSDIFISPSDPTTLMNPLTRERYVKLVDRTKVLSTKGQDGDTYRMNLYKKLNIETDYKANAGAIGDVSTNAIYVYFMFTGTNATAGRVVNIRMRFIDI